MAQRYTTVIVQGIFERLCADMGVPCVKPSAPHTPGAWRLDYNVIYGGYTVHEDCHGSTGVSLPIGPMRRPPREMWEVIHFARSVLANSKLVKP